jgi:PAS domain S-box-containing protein
MSDMTDCGVLMRDTDCSVFDAAPQPIIIADEVGNAKAINRAFVNTFGYPIGEISDRETRMCKLVPDESYRARLTQQWLDGARRFETSGMQDRSIVRRRAE